MVKVTIEMPGMTLSRQVNTPGNHAWNHLVEALVMAVRGVAAANPSAITSYQGEHLAKTIGDQLRGALSDAKD